MEPILSVDNVSLEYRSRVGLFKTFRHQAVSNASFDLYPGEVFGVLGKNGSGKSSLLKMIAGVLKPDQGKITLKANTSRALLSLGLGFNPQLSGRDNAIISGLLNGYAKHELMEVVEKIKEFSELKEFFERPVKSYSAGMKARLGFSSALLTKVDILLIDEVLSVGDGGFRDKAEDAMMTLINSDQTVIFVSHNDNQIKKLCNRCLWLENGILKDIGETTKVLKSYWEETNGKQA